MVGLWQCRCLVLAGPSAPDVFACRYRVRTTLSMRPLGVAVKYYYPFSNPHGKRLFSFGGALVAAGGIGGIDPIKMARQLVMLVIKYGGEGIDFDLENYSKSPSDLSWTMKLMCSTKMYFNYIQYMCNANPAIKQAMYPNLTDNTPIQFITTDASQPLYFVKEYWGLSGGGQNAFPFGFCNTTSCSGDNAGNSVNNYLTY